MKRVRSLIPVMTAVMILCSLIMFGGVSTVSADIEVLTLTTQERQLTLSDLNNMNGGSVTIVQDNHNRLTFIDGTCTNDPVRSSDDAGKVVVSMISLMGGDERTAFIPWSILVDTVGNTYYVFQQMYAGTTVLGGAVKVITDTQGNMIGLNASIETELPNVRDSEGITASEAEQIVLRHAQENKQQLTLFTDLTDKMILPVIISIDDDGDGDEARFVWVVYSNNPNSSVGQSSDMPYLAHYVTMDGTYLYSLATVMPGDSASSSGFDTAYIFDNMEPAEYSGTVTLVDGTRTNINVTLMRDKSSGIYYMGNIERKIVVADCWEFLYNHGNLVMESSRDNSKWDQTALLSLYNYCRAWDYYNEIGWLSGDGRGTPMLILNDYCDSEHNRVDNAAFMGNYLGWSIFAASQANDYSQCLDVIAHEFTHCVTGSVMTYNSYMNDYGAINEALSDIQGQICEAMLGATSDTEWQLGENSGSAVRSMSDPHSHSQPEFSWDLYYKPAVKEPTVINDYGGVHTNSSLLNNIAYRLIADGGMSLKDARAFWFAADCAMVPQSDYAQLRDLLPWVMKSLGMTGYQSQLQKAIDATRLGNSDLPSFFDEDRALLRLALPDNVNFTDSNWAMEIITIDVSGVGDKLKGIFMKILFGQTDDLPKVLRDLVGSSEDETASDPEAEADEFIEWFRKEFGDMLFNDMGSAGQDGRTVQMMSRPGRMIPVLFHLRFREDSNTADQVVYMVYLNHRWVELPIESSDSEDGEVDDDELTDAVGSEILRELLDGISGVRSAGDVLDLFSLSVKGGGITEIPATGLEKVVLPD